MKTNSILNEEMQGQKLTNFLAGYVLALAALFVALEYSQREVNVIVDEPVFSSVIFEDDMIPVTLHQEELPAPPPAAAPTVAEFFTEVPDETFLPELDMEIIGPTDAISSVPGPGVTDNRSPGVIDGTGPKLESTPIEDYVDVDPEFPGDINKWLSEHLKYPTICQEQGVQGRVVVIFVVNTDGSIEQVKTHRSPNPYLSMEAERVVNMMPKWTPARKNNEYVRSYFTLPILFRLN